MQILGGEVVGGTTSFFAGLLLSTGIAFAYVMVPPDTLTTMETDVIGER